MKKNMIYLLLLFTTLSTLVACSNKSVNQISIAAASSLEQVFVDEIIPLYEKANNIKIKGIFDASGKLQTQIQQGLEVDLFLSASSKQNNELIKNRLTSKENTTVLFSNEVVLITNKNVNNIKSFKDILKADKVAIADYESVPVGQYSKEILTNLGIFDQVYNNASIATNVTEVLQWVANGNAQVGLVYKSDAIKKKDVKIVATASNELLKTPIEYPISILNNSMNKEEAQKFIRFLKSKEVLAIFKKNGFLIRNESSK